MQPGYTSAAASATETAQISATVGTDARRDQPQAEATGGTGGHIRLQHNAYMAGIYPWSGSEMPVTIMTPFLRARTWAARL